MNAATPTDGGAREPLTLRLPATSANLGPGFDALGLALGFSLHVRAIPAASSSIIATGRNVEAVQNVRESLVLTTYRDVLAHHGVAAPQLALTVHNDVPLGMGCGSSAAALVAGVALAVHYGQLAWNREEILAEASRREGHPDNVAACVLGGLTASAMQTGADGQAVVQAVGIPVAVPWRVLVAMPQASLSTKTARALLPEVYPKPDAITNVQNVALLTAAFTTGRGELLRNAMTDRMHQPYRAAACPLLPALLPMASYDGVLGVALSGAGPSVLLLVEEGADENGLSRLVESTARRNGLDVEVLSTLIGGAAELGL